MTKINLKWRFTAYYNDNTSYRQPDDDTSLQNPGKSSYADVDQEKLTNFTLSNSSHFFSINLLTGEFMTNAGRFKLHTDALTDIKLLYYRRVTAQLSENTEQPLAYTIEYHFGFTAKDTQGNLVKYFIAVA